ncbi:MAG TPA: polyketide synthase, partial [Kofleriaceae bacterium]|nr:polyketide synthase [Kofleriaceae bacterium]
MAIVGMAGRFPGADSVDAFWQNLVGGVESITRFSDDELAAAGVPAATLADPRYVRARAAMDGADLFDAALFGLSQREAQITDPQHRLMLELAWHALEDAGCDPERFPGAIGVYGSVSWSSYLFQLLARPDLTAGLDGHQIMFGNDKDYFATRVAYKLGLRGPAVVVQSACSSSLVAAHAAYQGLLAGECDLALAGGVTVMMPRAQGYHVKPGTVSADGHCRPFSRGGDGTVPGDGAGVIAMKRFEDAVADGSTIHAVIIGSAVNND